MNSKSIIIAGVVLLVLGYGIGRFTTPDKIVTQTKIVTVTDEKSVTDKKVDSTTKITEVKNKDGTVTTVTEIDSHSDTNRQKEKDTSIVDEETKTVENNKSSLNVSVMAGLDVTNPAGGYIIGGQITKRMLGPITLGVWGLSNKTGGLSVGLQF